MPSAELVAALIAIEGRPWAEWKAGKPLTANGLARLLAPFGIAPATIRTATGTPKGYQLTQFEDAFARYLPGRRFEPPHRHNLDGARVSCALATATFRCLLRIERARNAYGMGIVALWRIRQHGADHSVIRHIILFFRESVRTPWTLWYCAGARRVITYL